MYGISSISSKEGRKYRGVKLSKGKVFIQILLLLFLFRSTFAQSEIDSLKAALKETRGLQRAELLMELSDHTRQRNMEKAIVQVQEALSIAKRSGDEELQSESLAQLAWFYTGTDRDTTALKYYLKALQIERRHGHRLEAAFILYNLGRFYRGQSNHPKALNYYFQALRIYKEEGDKSEAADALVSIGRIYDDREKSEQAIIFYKKAYALSKSVKSYSEMSFAASGAAYAFKEIEKYKKSLDYFDKALKAANNINSKHRLHAQANILSGISSVYQDQQLFQKAIAISNKQLRLARANESRMLQAYGLENLAELYRIKGNLERSNQYFKKAISKWGALGLDFGSSLSKLAENYIRQKKFYEAVRAAQKGFQQAEESGSLQLQKALLETLIQAYSKQKTYLKALQAQRKLVAVNEQIYNHEKAQQIAEMQTRYETEQKEQQIALLQKEQEKTTLIRNAFAAGLVLIIIIGLLVYNRQRLKINKNKTDLENTRLQEQQLGRDLEFKNKQLTTHSLNLVQKNEVMKELNQRISEIQQSPNGQTDKELRKLQHLVDYSFNLDEDWEDFRCYFEEVHTGFFDSLKKQYPDLTAGELRLCALVKLNLTIKETASILNISPDSVKTARYRLRKKLAMSTEEDLTDFMMDVEKTSSIK